jgi:hypothetical protein
MREFYWHLAEFPVALLLAVTGLLSIAQAISRREREQGAALVAASAVWLPVPVVGIVRGRHRQGGDNEP